MKHPLARIFSGIAIIVGVAFSTAALAGNGADVAIAVVDGSVTIDNATVIKTDIAASNGVIHVIDSVIVPK